MPLPIVRQTAKQVQETGRVADELEYLQAKYQYCCVLEKNKALGIDSSLRLVLRRYAELLNGYRQYGIDANGYRDLAVNYCQGLCLMAQVQLRYGNREEAGLHVKNFLTMPHKYLLDRRLRDSLAQITQVQQALRED